MNTFEQIEMIKKRRSDVPSVLRESTVADLVYVFCEGDDHFAADVFVAGNHVTVTDLEGWDSQSWFGETEGEDGPAEAWSYILSHYGPSCHLVFGNKIVA